jgi:membrane protein
MGAAIAYYTLFSIAPLLIIVIAVAGFVYGEEAAQGQIFEQLRGLLGPEGATAIEGLVKSASEPAKGTFATIAGIVTLVVGATTVFAELQSDLDRIWKAPAAPKATGIWKLLRTRLLSFGLVLGLGFLLLVSLVLSAALSALGSFYGGFFGSLEWLLQVVNFVVSFAVITVLFAMIYKLLPRVDISWRDVWIGAAVTALLFDIGKFALGLYLGKSSVVSGFGAAGSLVVLLIWVYYSAQIFLLGAEFTWAYAHRYGSRKEAAQRQRETRSEEARGPAAPPQAAASAAAPAAVEELAAPLAASATLAAADELPTPSNDEIVELVPHEDTASRAAHAADRHPAMSLAVAAAGFALAGFLSKLVSNRRRLAAR